MIQKALQFPHIPRLFSATVCFVTLWAGLGLAFAINTLLRQQSPPDTTYRFLLETPRIASSHTQAALTLWNQGRHEEAKHEAAIAQDLAVMGGVLGISISAEELLNTWEAEPARLQEEYVFWKQVSEQKQDYRDAFLMAATRAYQLGYIQQARTLIEQAVQIDPGSSAIQLWKTHIEAGK
jgi:tetratricopeptide (TPR) repeat protein